MIPPAFELPLLSRQSEVFTPEESIEDVIPEIFKVYILACQPLPAQKCHRPGLYYLNRNFWLNKLFFEFFLNFKICIFKVLPFNKTSPAKGIFIVPSLRMVYNPDEISESKTSIFNSSWSEYGSNCKLISSFILSSNDFTEVWL